MKGIDVSQGGLLSLVSRDAIAGNTMAPGIAITNGIIRAPGGRVEIASIGGSQVPEIHQASVDIDTLFIQGLDAQGQALQDTVSLGGITLFQGAGIDASWY